MKAHVILDTATVTKEFAGGARVGSGVTVKRGLEEDRTKLKETQRLTKPTDKRPETNDLGVNLKFAVDKETGEQLVKVLDSETGEVVRQFPPEEFLQVIKSLRNLKGMLFSAKL